MKPLRETDEMRDHTLSVASSSRRFSSWGVGPSGEGSKTSDAPTRRNPCCLYVNSVVTGFDPKPTTDSKRLGVASGCANRWSCVSIACIPNCMSVSELLVCRYSLLFGLGRLLVNGAHLLLIGRVRLGIWAGVHAVASRYVTYTVVEST